MQLVTRLLLRLLAVGTLMMVLVLILTMLAARRDIADEMQGSQRVGQLIATLVDLQGSQSIEAQARIIDELNQNDTLRHFHVALMDQQGKRLTQGPSETASESGLMAMIYRFLASDASMSGYALSLQRLDGQKVTLMLEPNPRSESSEAITGAILQMSLFASFGLALIIAIWVSMRMALAPLADILSGISRIEQGDYAARIAPSATRELNQIGQALNHLAEALTEQIAKQRDLLHRLQEVQEDERRKLAHELHDEFGQLLTAIQVDASYLLKQSAGQPALESCAQAMFENSSSILNQLRSLLAQLRPYGLQGGEEHDIALEQALRELVRQRQSRGDAALECSLTVNLNASAVPQRLAVAIYRIAQEALTNVMRHSGASAVHITLMADAASHTLTLKVADNGSGMAHAAVSRPEGIGLIGIRERVLANQGRLELQAAVPQGLLLIASFPLEPVISDEVQHVS